MENALIFIRENINSLAEKITDLQFENNTSMQSYGNYGRTKCTEDSIFHLNYLVETIEAKSPVLFYEYIKWTAIMLKARNIEVVDLLANLDYINVVLNKAVPAITAKVEHYTEGAKKEIIKELDVETFIVDKNPLSNQARNYLDLLLKAKKQQASELVMDLVKTGTSVKDVYDNIFLPTQYEIGRLWQLNKISVGQEHYATAATQLIISQLYPQIFSSIKNDKTLIATCISGDLHEIGLRMVTDFFEMEGWNTHYLGANTPQQSIIQFAKDNNADIIAISVTMTYNISKVTKIIESIKKDPELYNVKILVGGYPFLLDEELYKKVGADATANSAGDAIKKINELIS